MYGDHTAAWTNQLVNEGGFTQQQANVLASLIGQCQASLSHRGAISLYGPLTMANDVKNKDGEVVVNQDGATLLGGQAPSYYLNYENFTGSPGVGLALAKVKTLASDLDAGDTVVIDGDTYSGIMIRPSYKLAAGTTITGVPDGTQYIVLGWNDCEQPQ